MTRYQPVSITYAGFTIEASVYVPGQPREDDYVCVEDFGIVARDEDGNEVELDPADVGMDHTDVVRIHERLIDAARERAREFA